MVIEEAQIVRIPVLGLSLIALAGCSPLTPTSDPVYLRLQDIDARLIRIERVIENESLIELSTQLSQLQAETASLRGEIETLRYESENSATRDRDLYIDVDQRLQNLERGGQPRVVPPAGPTAQAVPNQAAAPPPAVGDQEAYNAAFALIQNRRYEEATRAFTDFLVVYPESALRDNAQYWLAETYYVRRQFAVALPEFQTVLDAYPQSAKLADALLKVGYCNHELGQIDAARTALREVQRLYPETTAARLAGQRLERISQETG
jgi:tol-pal system protein YbgF